MSPRRAWWWWRGAYKILVPLHGEDIVYAWSTSADRAAVVARALAARIGASVEIHRRGQAVARVNVLDGEADTAAGEALVDAWERLDGASMRSGWPTRSTLVRLIAEALGERGRRVSPR